MEGNDPSIVGKPGLHRSDGLSSNRVVIYGEQNVHVQWPTRDWPSTNDQERPPSDWFV